MRTTPRCLLVALVLAAAVGINSAPAAAEPDCQDLGGVTVCAQGSVTAGDQFGDDSFGPLPDINDLSSNACTNQYGTYQNCNGR
jgi:hypothetical protein